MNFSLLLIRFHLRKVFIWLIVCTAHLFVNGFDLKCDFDQQNWRGVSGYTCTTKNVNVKWPNATVTSINGQTKVQGYNVKIIYFASQTVNFLPSGIENFFPNLEGIWIHNSKLKSINKLNIKPFPKLKQLYLPNNDVEVLDDDIFEVNPELIYINFRNNKLKVIGRHIFNRLANLKTVIFINNTCIDSDASVESNKTEIAKLIGELINKCQSSEQLAAMLDKQDFIIQELHKVIEEKEVKIELLELKLKEFEAQLKSSDGNLDTAVTNLFSWNNKDFGVEHFEEIGLTCTLFDEESCKVVNLQVKFSETSISRAMNEIGNKIETDDIKRLIIADQQTFFLPINLGVNFQEITELIVDSSGLYQIDPQSFENMKFLLCLILSNNKIFEIPTSAFKNLKNLRFLDLSINKLKSLKIGAFKGLRNVEQLMLNNNLLTMISSNSFDSLIKLKNLTLHNNSLKFISPNFLTQFPQLSTVDFTNNICVNLSFPNDTKAKIEKTIVDQCIEHVELKCNFFEDKIFLDQATSFTAYMCDVHESTFESTKTKIWKISGIHAPHYDIRNVTAFVSINQKIKFLPLNLAKLLPRLEKIVVEQSGLVSIGKHDFEGFFKLLSISMQRNNMTSIDEGTFDDVIKLEYVNLAFNHITSLPSQLFVNNPRIRTLILSFNQIESLSADILIKKSAVNEFRIDHNQLESVDTKIFKSLRKAHLIDFSANECIDAKYDKGDVGGTSFAELHQAIDIDCDE